MSSAEYPSGMHGLVLRSLVWRAASDRPIQKSYRQDRSALYAALRSRSWPRMLLPVSKGVRTLAPCSYLRNQEQAVHAGRSFRLATVEEPPTAHKCRESCIPAAAFAEIREVPWWNRKHLLRSRHKRPDACRLEHPLVQPRLSP